MALSASPDVFPSFHGEDVRRGLLSYLLKEFREKGIDVFIDNNIKRSKSIGPALIQAIRGSLIAIVLVSKNYASSTWCLNELVEIVKCRDKDKQTVMVISHEVTPSDVKKQTGYFGHVFKKTCSGKTTEEVRRWRKALQEVAKIAAYRSLEFDSDAVMIETIATDISNMLNECTTSNDSDNIVGIGAHIKKIESLLSLESDEVRMVGIWGPAGIGKTTIARALYRSLCSKFTHTAFIESIKGKFENIYRDEHEFMLYLQAQLLSKTFNQKDLKISHLGVAKARLKNKRVLVIIDDVDDVKQLEAMANKTWWFGPGSRIIITTKDKKLLKAHEINHIYRVFFPSTSEALEILCLYTFGQNSPPSGFKEMAREVTRLAGDLPLGLRVFGAYLRGMSKDQWIHALPRLRTSLDGNIEKVLRFSYDALCDDDQELFLHIACFFNDGCVSDLVECLADSHLNVIHGLQVLVDKSFISIYEERYLLIHNLLEQLGKKIVRGQSSKPGKRQFLVDPREICDVLADNKGTGTIRGIDFDLSEIKGELNVDERAFGEMSGLQFLRFKGLFEDSKLLLPQGLKFRASKLRYLQWDQYPLTFLPREFHPNCLVKLDMQDSRLEKLWDGPVPLPCLKLIDLSGSDKLIKVPNLSNATNLEVLRAAFCVSLVELPCSIGKATSLEQVHLPYCLNLMAIPSSIGNATNIKTLNFLKCESLVELPSSIWSLKRLRKLSIVGCSNLNHLVTQLKFVPDVSANITELDLSNTEIEEIPSSIQYLSCLTKLRMQSCRMLKVIPTNINLESLSSLDLNLCTQLKMFPEISTSIEYLGLVGTAIEEVPSSIWSWLRLLKLNLANCESLQVFHMVHDNIEELDLSNTETNFLETVPVNINCLPLPLRIDLSGCKNLVSLPLLPEFVSFLDAAGCESLERVDGLFNNPEACINFANCFKLSQEAKDVIKISDCKSALLPGGDLPADFDHRARGDFLTVNLDQRPLPIFMRFKACILLLHGTYDDDEDHHLTGNKMLSCRIWYIQNEVVIGYGSCKYHLPSLLGLAEHLYFFESSISLNFPEAEGNVSKLEIEFKITGQYWDIKECGVQLLEDPTVHDDHGCCENIYNETEADIKIARTYIQEQ